MSKEYSLISERKKQLSIDLCEIWENTRIKYKDILISERSTAQKIEGTDLCMIVVPCKFAGKRVVVQSLDLR